MRNTHASDKWNARVRTTSLPNKLKHILRNPWPSGLNLAQQLVASFFFAPSSLVLLSLFGFASGVAISAMPGFAQRVRKHYLKKSGERGRTTAKMDDGQRAMCYALRHPPGRAKPMKLNDIQELVRKTNGREPTLQAISGAARTYMDPKLKRGRRVGDRATTKLEDKQILKTFHKVRPPGYGVDSRTVHGACTKTIQKKIGRRTISRS